MDTHIPKEFALLFLAWTFLTINIQWYLSVFQEVLKWHESETEKIGASVKLNADCIIHATLEEDKETLQILYSFGYRLGQIYH